MCTPTKPSRGGADSWDGGGGDDDGVSIFDGGIDFQEASSYKSRPNLEEVTITMHRVLLTYMKAERNPFHFSVISVQVSVVAVTRSSLTTVAELF